MTDLHLIPGGAGATPEPPAPPVQTTERQALDRLADCLAWVGVPTDVDGIPVRPGHVVAVFDADAMPELVAQLLRRNEEKTDG